MAILYSPDGKDSIDAHIDQVEYLKSKGWTEKGNSSKSVSKNNKKSEEQKWQHTQEKQDL